MSISRKRSSPGFSSESVNESTDLFVNTDYPDPEFTLEESLEVQEEPYIEVVITPLEDPGPRFVEPVEIPKKEYKVPTPPVQPVKRHPRNIPKFSRWS